MKTARALWNFCLLIAGGLIAWIIVPKLVAQIRVVRDFETAWVAVQGAGLLISAALCLASFGTWAWRRVGRAARALYVVVTLAFTAGVLVSAQLDSKNIGFIFWGGYITFFGTFVVFAFPIVGLGTSYPGLAIRLIGRRKQSEPD